MKSKRGTTEQVCSLSADYLGHLLFAVVFVVAGFGLCCRGEYWFGQLFRFAQALWQLMAANLGGPLVVLPARAGQVAAHDAFNWKDVRSPNEHRASPQLGCVVLHRLGHFVNLSCEEMIWNDVRQPCEPKPRQRGEHFALAFDWRRDNAIKCRDAIGRYDQQTIAIDFVNVSNFAAAKESEIGETS